MKRFLDGQRVVVKQNANGIALNTPGVVRRLRTDGGAWVALDVRSKVESVHPFPADDSRGTHVLAYADDCELPTETSKERRTAARAAKEPEVTLASFGRDHWSTFGYIETCVVDNGGVVDIRHMRCDSKRHPWIVHLGQEHGEPGPTRLKNGALVSGHDDWDCVDDLIMLGLLENAGTSANPVYKMTQRGDTVAAALRKHKINGGTFATFEAPT